MRKNVKLTSVVLAGLMSVVYIAPGFTQGYQAQYSNQSPNQRYNQNYTQGYNTNYTQQYNQNYLPPLQGRVVTVPSGTYIPSATASTDISSEFLTVGDGVTVTLASDFYYNGNVVLPAGTRMSGNVVVAEKAGLTGKSGKLKVVFNNATTPNGQRIPVSGKIATENGTGLLVGGTNVARVGNAVKQGAVGAGIGALIGTFMGPLSGGKVGKGAVYGTAVGGGLGLAKSMADRGQNVVIPAGSSVDIVLDQPLTVGPESNYNY